MKADLVPPTDITPGYNNEIPQGTMTPDTVETRIGKLSFENGFPSEETTRKLFKPLGIEKGKEFKPHPRQRKILEEAAQMGDAMGRVMLFEGPDRFRQPELFPGSKWYWVFQVNPVQGTDTYGQIDKRLHYTYGPIYATPALGVMKAGPGGSYVQTFKDKDGNRFDGGKSYRLHVPANAPADLFWSLTLYDTATRSMIQNPSNDSVRSSLDKLKTNADGSLDLYFGPAGSAPAGLEANWIESLPSKGFYPMFRFYYPMAGLSDGTWKLPDFELMNKQGLNKAWRPGEIE